MRIFDAHTIIWDNGYRKGPDMPPTNTETTKRRPVNLTIREDVINEARALNLNASQAAEAGIAAAIKAARQAQWLAENSDAIEAHNKRVEDKGVLIEPRWAR